MTSHGRGFTSGLDAEVNALLEDRLSDTDEADLRPVTKEDVDHAHQKKHVGQRLRLLPSPMRAKLARVRNPYMLQQVLDRVVEKAKEDAERWEARVQTSGADTWAPVHDAVIKRVIRESWETSEYRGWFRGVRTEVLGTAHLLHRKDVLTYADVAHVEIPAGATWRARSDVELGSTPTLECMAEEVALVIASLITGRTTFEDPRSEGEDEALRELLGVSGLDETDVDILDASTSAAPRVLHLGAGPSTLAIAVDALERHVSDAAPRTRIVEVDAYLWERETRCLEGPRMPWTSDLGSLEGPFDVLFLTPPCPGVGVAAQLRGLYLNDGTRTEHDPGRLGPKKWIRTITEALSAGLQVLREGGLVIMYIPLGVRSSFEDAGEEPKWGTTYVTDPKLGDFVKDVLTRFELEVVRTLEVEEAEPRPQPYVGRRRPQYMLVIARKGARHG